MKTIVFSICFLGMTFCSFSQWNSQISGTNQLLTSIQFLDADTGYCSAQSGLLLKTTNGGTNWNTVCPNIGGERFFFINADTGFAYFGQDIMKTSNGGLSWTSKIHSTSSSFESLSFPTASIGFTTRNNDTYDSVYVYSSTDYGDSWNLISKLPGTDVFSSYFVDVNTGFICNIIGDIYRTSNGGLNWTLVHSITSSFYIEDFYFVDANNGYAVTDQDFLVTIDGGLTWQESNPPYSPIYYSIDCPSPGNCHIVGGDGFSTGTLMNTINSGASWTQTGTTNITYTAVDFINDTTGWACGGNGSIIKYSGSPVVPTSIEENKISEIKIYPNPADDHVIINSNNYSVGTTCCIFNLLGETVYTQGVNGNKITIDVSNLPIGTYILTMIDEQKVTTQKLLVYR